MAGTVTTALWRGCIDNIVHVKLGELGETLQGQYRAKPTATVGRCRDYPERE